MLNSLQRIGFTDITEAVDGKEALSKFDSSIGFIITDWNMPNLGGVDLRVLSGPETMEQPSRS